MDGFRIALSFDLYISGVIGVRGLVWKGGLGVGVWCLVVVVYRMDDALDWFLLGTDLALAWSLSWFDCYVWVRVRFMFSRVLG